MLLRRRPAKEAEPDARTEELRRKLAEAREAEPSEPAAPEPEPEVDVEEARRRVHEEARAAVDEMQRSGEDG